MNKLIEVAVIYPRTKNPKVGSLLQSFFANPMFHFSDEAFLS